MLEEKLKDFEKSSDSHLGIFKGSIEKIIKDLEILARFRELDNLPTIDLQYSAAGNMYKNVQLLYSTLKYEDPRILKILKNEDLAKIPSQEAEKCHESEFNDEAEKIQDKILGKISRRQEPEEEEEEEELDWGSEDEEGYTPR
ncbi:Uncharacterised protein [Legionella steigerwaltii]|uniref:Uncharacterized protein n=1 Tax=Legionella steigerwaltii TaxID=460 RepID=A0A378L8F8_9GAMM|nr:hypothetical protein [Legionella steigerwaltii]KTD77677.1 hypothetical protein Lstg_2034 [Legionella steigerwaltii]STY22987.1 Uncharacterised protein [Legionella steigerwaltii]